MSTRSLRWTCYDTFIAPINYKPLTDCGNVSKLLIKNSLTLLHSLPSFLHFWKTVPSLCINYCQEIRLKNLFSLELENATLVITENLLLSWHNVANYNKCVELLVIGQPVLGDCLEKVAKTRFMGCTWPATSRLRSFQLTIEFFIFIVTLF